MRRPVESAVGFCADTKRPQTAASQAGIQFHVDFDKSGKIHDRSITTDTGWKILPGRGLDFYQYVSNDAFDMAGRLQ